MRLSSSSMLSSPGRLVSLALVLNLVAPAQAAPANPPAPKPATAAPPVATTVPETPAEMVRRLQEIPTELPGWKITQEPVLCDRTCLATHLPEDAQLVLDYGFAWSVRARVTPPQPHKDLMVDVFRMSEDLDAFGVFARHHTDASVPTQIAAKSFWIGNQLHVWRGTFYLRVTPTADDKLLRASAQALGEQVAADIPLPEQLPLLMRLMPQARSLPDTLRYYRHGVLGQETLGDGLVDQYLEDDDHFTLALLRSPDQDGAVRRFSTLIDMLGGAGTATPVTDLNAQTVMVNSDQFGLSYIMREGSFVAVAVHVHSRETAEALLQILGTSIRISQY